MDKNCVSVMHNRSNVPAFLSRAQRLNATSFFLSGSYYADFFPDTKSTSLTLCTSKR